MGLGRMGHEHLGAALSLGLDVVGLADINFRALSASLSSIQGLSDNINLYDDSTEMFRREKPELVCIATTATSRATTLTQALETDSVSYILCEKPWVNSLQQSHDLVGLVGHHGVRVAINHQMRFMPQYKLVKDYHNSGIIGGLRTMNVVAPNFGWANNGSHYIEAFLWLSGASVVACAGYFEEELVASKRGPEFWDSAGQVFLRGQNGHRLMMEFGSDLGSGITVVYGFEGGQVVVDELNGRGMISGRSAEFLDRPSAEYGLPSWTDSFNFDSISLSSSTAKVMSALLEGSNFATEQTAHHILECLVAGIESTRDKSTLVQLQSLFDRGIHLENFSWS